MPEIKISEFKYEIFKVPMLFFTEIVFDRKVEKYFFPTWNKFQNIEICLEMEILSFSQL